MKIKCKLCNFESSQLQYHVRKEHNLSGKQYKTMFPEEKLSIKGEEMRNRLSKAIKGTTHKDKLPLETRTCACGCGETFECVISDGKRYVRNGHWGKGKKRSKEISEKIRVALKGGKMSERASLNMSKARKGKPLSEKNLIGIRKAANDPEVKKKRYTKERNDKISKTRSIKIANGYNPENKSYKGRYISSLTGNAEYYASLYELERMKQLDKAGIRWTKKHGIVIEYVDLYGKTKRTVPDFRIMTHPKMTIEETKNYLDEDRYWKCLKTIEWCERNNCDYKVLFKSDIFESEEQYESIRKNFYMGRLRQLKEERGLLGS